MMKKQMLIIILAALLLIYFLVIWQGSNSNDVRRPTRLLRPTTKQAPVTKFEILSYRGVWREYRGLAIIGEIKNVGSKAAGVKIEVIARDTNGVLVDSASFWPASIRNIPPGGTCGIDHTITEDKRAKTIEVKIVRVTVW